MEEGIVNAGKESESASDALKLFVAMIFFFCLGYFSFITWNGFSDKITLIITLSTAIPFILFAFSTTMAVITKSRAHIDLAEKIIKYIMFIWSFLFVVTASVFFYFGAVSYSEKEMTAIIEIEFLSNLTLETHRWGLFAVGTVCALFAIFSFLTPKLVRFLWLIPLSGKLVR